MLQFRCTGTLAQLIAVLQAAAALHRTADGGSINISVQRGMLGGTWNLKATNLLSRATIQSVSAETEGPTSSVVVPAYS